MPKSRRPGLSARDLRLLALGLMLLDHLAYTGILPGSWIPCLGRLAFPIFAFQISEGYCHTRDFRRYCGRLALFAVISEIPFDLMTAGRLFAPGHQNVMLTLLLGLLAIHFADRSLRGESSGERLSGLCGVGAVLLSSVLTAPDYGCVGVVTVLGFFLARSLPGCRLWQTVFLLVLHGFSGGPRIAVGPLTVPVQGFAVFALLPIWLYTGEKGCTGKWVQALSYWFYPVHLLILGLI